MHAKTRNLLLYCARMSDIICLVKCVHYECYYFADDFILFIFLARNQSRKSQH